MSNEWVGDVDIFEFNPWAPRKGPPWPPDVEREIARVEKAFLHARLAVMTFGPLRWSQYLMLLEHWLQ